VGYATPTGEPCPRCVRLDGSVAGSGSCTSCGCCLLLAFAEWPGREVAPDAERRS
jgi:hypothetical protein